jgi:heme-degrading monooxygenase HmoA
MLAPTSAGDKRPMIFRKWTGRIRTGDRAAYVAYIVETGLADYARTPGNRGYQMVTRDLGDGTTEVSTMSWWDSMDSIRGFAGDEPERARYYPEDDAFLVERPEHVEHHLVEAGCVVVEIAAGGGS